MSIPQSDSRCKRDGFAQTELPVDLPHNDPSGIVGLIVRLDTTCRTCGGDLARVTGGKGPHAAGAVCECGRHRAWISHTTHEFLAGIVSKLGKPTEPIEIRTGTGMYNRAATGTKLEKENV
jgi:hypothetical protein